MGYYTRYEITRVSDDENAFRAELANVMSWRLEEGEPSKWYRHSEDIATAMVATKTKEVDLHGIGEDDGDVWDKEYRLVSGKVMVTRYGYTLVRNIEPKSTKEVEP